MGISGYVLDRLPVQSWKFPLSSIMGKGGSTFCCRPLIAHQQGQTGLSTVGAAHSLAVDWLGWVCYLLGKLGFIKLPLLKTSPLAAHVLEYP